MFFAVVCVEETDDLKEAKRLASFRYIGLFE